MSARRESLQLQAAPFLHTPLTTPRLMNEVTLTLMPVVAAAMWFFGLCALLVVAAATAGAMLTEWWLMARRGRRGTLRDGSALLTGVLLGLTLPPALPLWMAFVGGFVAIALGKLSLGGLGQNFFNPALVGRAFLQAAFPVAITTWVPPHAAGFFALPATTLAPPFLHAELDGMSAATPLAHMKLDHAGSAFADLWLGNTAGSLGETCTVLLLLCGLWLGFRRAFDWRIPIAVLGSALLLAAALHFADPLRCPPPWFVLGSGGLVLGAVYMATDPVTSPMTSRGMWAFGIGIGVLVVLIRDYGGLPEGVMYAILLMNAATPLIERVAQPRPFGRARRA